MSRKVVRGTRLDISFTFARPSPARVTAAISPKCTWLLSHPSGPMGEPCGCGMAWHGRDLKIDAAIRQHCLSIQEEPRWVFREKRKREIDRGARSEGKSPEGNGDLHQGQAVLCIARLRLCDVLSPDYAHEQPLLFLLWINTGCTKWCAKLVKKDPGRARQSR